MRYCKEILRRTIGYDPLLRSSSRRVMAKVFCLHDIDLWISNTPYYRFLQNLKLVAVDELHYYTGTFGRYVSRTMIRLIDLNIFQSCGTGHPTSKANMRCCGECVNRSENTVQGIWLSPDHRVRFVSCSATITNPGIHMKRMFGVDVSWHHWSVQLLMVCIA